MQRFITNNIEIKIYNSKSLMRRAIRRVGFKCDYTEAMVIPCTVYNKEGKKVPLFGEMYLHRGVTMPVLVHETLHAATTKLRRDKENLHLGRGINYREELLAYTQSSILQDILKLFFPKKNSEYIYYDIKKMARMSVIK